jgi:hypothetical protein|tara:strand:+ start:114 stop:473 length:360 start_codon:yes stop_codon:yes gene_type:complete
MDSEPHYSNYTLEELYDVLEHIDHDSYPERVEKIKGIIQIKMKDEPAIKESKKFTLKEKYLFSVSILSLLIIATLFLGLIPMKGLSWITKEEAPLYYWGVVSGLTVLTLFYVNKYRKVQ